MLLDVEVLHNSLLIPHRLFQLELTKTQMVQGFLDDEKGVVHKHHVTCPWNRFWDLEHNGQMPLRLSSSIHNAYRQIKCT